ncbi:DUF4097 family beta strand repeat-containing protein [Nocardia callitridis]|uniref:DUF4097 domain-containing protein n=1 Tax=Nocardia callitridis TaxID=648753 RepID=A0ABP9KDH2_9NOCA
MPKFDTPEPISVTLELGVGNVRITASKRADTTVEVRASDGSDTSAVQAAEQTRVTFANGVLNVAGPKPRIFDFSRDTKSIEVTIELPDGSEFSGKTHVGNLVGTGRLGECTFKTAVGNVQLARTGPLRANTSAGHITVRQVTGDVVVDTSTGKVDLGEVDGAVEVKNSNGDTEIEAATGNVRVRSANGSVTIGRPGADVVVRTSHGAVRLAEVVRGSVEIATGMGELTVGIAEGTAAWLDMNTSFGQVHNLLDNTTAPDKSDETVEVRGRTSFGDITIRRS